VSGEPRTCHRCGRETTGGIIVLEDEVAGGVVSTCWDCAEIEGREEDARLLTGGLAHWRYDVERLVLVHAQPHSYAYEVDPERIRTPAEALDWIAQVAGKTWAREEPACVGELVIALDVLLHFQATLCGCGISRRISPRKLLLQRHAELGL
jgi:hypothetical protein